MLESSATASLSVGYRLASACVLEFRILGPLEVLVDDRAVRLGGPKQRAALAILLLGANRVVSVERLADDLYAGAPPVTAVTQVQRQVSELRKVLGPTAIETRSPGYLVHVESDALDLDRFERWTHEATKAAERSDPQGAFDVLSRALDLWRGAPLADLAYESFAQTAIARLEELRLAALEQRFDAELELGRHAQLLAELETLVWEHPLRERLRGQLMLALYRAGRQADSLEIFRRTRATLVEEFGIEPSRSLVELERMILTQDPSLDHARAAVPARQEQDRTLLVAARDDEELDRLLPVAASLASLPERSLIVARLLASEDGLGSVSTALAARCAALAVPTRSAVFTSLEPARDIVRLAASYDVELVLLGSSNDLGAVVEHSPADVAVLAGPPVELGRGSGVVVLFGGAENDWAALELAAWLAGSARINLFLAGTTADPARGRRDASRLLADASLATQRVVGVSAEPLLVEPTPAAALTAVAGATVVVAGLPNRWRAEGLGAIREALVEAERPPVMLVHSGTRPGGLAPRESLTRFSWSLSGA
jgi:DNA-binding SARP family transcriptional activator